MLGPPTPIPGRWLHPTLLLHATCRCCRSSAETKRHTAAVGRREICRRAHWAEYRMPGRRLGSDSGPRRPGGWLGPMDGNPPPFGAFCRIIAQSHFASGGGGFCPFSGRTMRSSTNFDASKTRMCSSVRCTHPCPGTLRGASGGRPAAAVRPLAAGEALASPPKMAASPA